MEAVLTIRVEAPGQGKRAAAELLTVTPTSEATFLKLVPLVGG